MRISGDLGAAVMGFATKSVDWHRASGSLQPRLMLECSISLERLVVIVRRLETDHF
jgi:hypothetical protein